MERLRALLIAPPGAGKGTQATRICDHFGVTHVSTGDVFRAEVAAGSKLGRSVQGYLDRGDLVPDGVVGEVVGCVVGVVVGWVVGVVVGCVVGVVVGVGVGGVVGGVTGVGLPSSSVATR